MLHPSHMMLMTLVAGVTLGPVDREFTHADVAFELEQALGRWLLDPRALEISFFPGEEEADRGFFPRVDFTLDEAVLTDRSDPPGSMGSSFRLVLAHLVLRDVRIDVESLFLDGIPRLESAWLESGRIVVDLRDLNRLLSSGHASASVRGLRVDSDRDRIYVSGRLDWGLVTPAAQVMGRLRISRSGHQLLFLPDRADFGPIAGTRKTLETLFQKVNPLIDLGRIGERTRLRATFRDVVVEPGYIVLELAE